jgi:tetratricopeptide (TPR) repeat protein
MAIDLVGRRHELGDLFAALDDVFARRGRVMLLVGEPGIGKTTLADAVAARATARGARVAWGRCWEPGGAPAFWPWTQALSALLDDRDALALAGPDILRLMPSQAHEAPAATDPASARFTVARAAAQLLRALAEEAPIVVVLDDLHAADHASLDLLHALSRDVTSAPLLIIGTHRDADVTLTDEVAARLAAVAREAMVLHLPRLAPEETAELVRRAARGVEVAAPIAQAIFSATQGNPLFVDEVVRLLAARGALAHVTRAEDVPIPLGVREAVRRRVGALDDEARAVLEAIAVLGDARDARCVAAVAGVSPESVAAAIAQATQAGVLVDGVRFSHALFREVLERDLPQTRRDGLHAAAARTLARLPVPPHRDVTRHLLAAGRAHTEEAVGAVEEHARALARSGAADDAVALVERARGALALDLDAELSVRLHVALGDALVQAGRREALDTCFEAAGRAEKLANAALLARAALAAGGVWRFGTVDARLIELLGRARAALVGGDERLLALVEARLAGAMQPAPDPWEAVKLARAAIGRARNTGDDKTILDALFFGLSAMVDYVHPDEALPLNRELLERAIAAGERAKVLRARLRIIFNHAERGAFDDVDREIDGYAAEAEAVGHPQHTWVIPLLRAMMALVRGDAEGYARHRQMAAEVAARGAVTHAPLTLLLHDLWRAMLTSDEQLARSISAAVEAAMPKTSPANVVAITAWLRWRTGDFTGAGEVLDRAHGLERDALDICIIAEVFADLQRPELARAISGALEQRRGLVVSMGQAAYGLINFHERHLAYCRFAVGERKEARRLLDTAMARAKELGAAAFVAQLERDLKRLGLEPVQREARSPTTMIRIERDGELWRVNGAFSLKDSRGLQILHALISRPGVDVHVLDLSSKGAADGGDAGELLDEDAKRAYRARLLELARGIESAEEDADLGRAERLREEKDVLEAELARAFGLGGRVRRAGSAAERARVAVQRRVRDAIERIREQDQALGRELDRSIKTGMTCRYDP